MSRGIQQDPQTLGEHLEDFKRLVIKCIATLFVGIIVSTLFMNQVFAIMLDPIRGVTVLNDGQSDQLVLTFLQVGGALTFQIDMILFASVVITSPLLLYWLWEFVRPALLPRERKFASIYVLIAGILALVGAVYAYKLILPVSLRFFSGLNQSSVLINTQFAIDANGYLDFFRTLFLATLVTFQVPIAIFTLLRTRVLPFSWIKENRKILYFALITALFILIPGDISISILVILPVIILLEVAIWLGKLGIRNQQ